MNKDRYILNQSYCIYMNKTEIRRKQLYSDFMNKNQFHKNINNIIYKNVDEKNRSKSLLLPIKSKLKKNKKQFKITESNKNKILEIDLENDKINKNFKSKALNRISNQIKDDHKFQIQNDQIQNDSLYHSIKSLIGVNKRNMKFVLAAIFLFPVLNSIIIELQYPIFPKQNFLGSNFDKSIPWKDFLNNFNNIKNPLKIWFNHCNLWENLSKISFKNFYLWWNEEKMNYSLNDIKYDENSEDESLIKHIERIVVITAFLGVMLTLHRNGYELESTLNQVNNFINGCLNNFVKEIIDLSFEKYEHLHNYFFQDDNDPSILLKTTSPNSSLKSGFGYFNPEEASDYKASDYETDSDYSDEIQSPKYDIVNNDDHIIQCRDSVWIGDLESESI